MGGMGGIGSSMMPNCQPPRVPCNQSSYRDPRRSFLAKASPPIFSAPFVWSRPIRTRFPAPAPDANRLRLPASSARRAGRMETLAVCASSESSLRRALSAGGCAGRPWAEMRPPARASTNRPAPKARTSWLLLLLGSDALPRFKLRITQEPQHHFILRPRAEANHEVGIERALCRAVRGAVERPFHVDPGALRQQLRFLQLVGDLPRLVISRDVKEQLFTAVGIGREVLRAGRTQVGVRPVGEYQRVLREHLGGADPIVGLVRRNLEREIPDGLALYLVLDGALRKVEPDLGLVHVPGARAAPLVVVHVEDDGRALLQLPAEAVGQDLRLGATGDATELETDGALAVSRFGRRRRVRLSHAAAHVMHRVLTGDVGARPELPCANCDVMRQHFFGQGLGEDTLKILRLVVDEV